MPLQQTDGAITPLVQGATGLMTSRIIQINAVYKSFHAIMSGAATVRVQGSNDPTQVSWVDAGVFTTGGGLHITQVWKYWRVNITAYTSGTISVYLGT